MYPKWKDGTKILSNYDASDRSKINFDGGSGAYVYQSLLLDAFTI